MYRLALKKSGNTFVQRCLHSQKIEVRQAGFGKFVVIIAPFATVGGAVTYAKHDQDFRKYLEKNIPGAESFLKIALQEEKPFKGVTEKIDSANKYIGDVTTTVKNFFGASEDKPQLEKTKSTEKIKIIHEQKPVEKSTSSSSVKQRNEPKSAPFKPAEPPLPNNVTDLEKAVEHASALAVKEYNKAIGILKTFNEDVRRVVDQAVENGDPSLWNTLKNKTSARSTAVETAEKLAREALNKIEQCEVALSKVVTAQNNQEVLKIRQKIKTAMDHLNKVKDELYREKDVSALSEKYWRNVEKARNYFIDEIESLFPGVNISEKRLKLSEDDLNLFVTHAYSHVLAYQKELQRLQTDGELRLKRAIEALRGSDENEALKAQLDYQLEVEKRKIALENHKRILQIRAEAEQAIRKQLKKQAEAHNDHLLDAIALKEMEMKRNFGRELEDKLEAEKANYKLQLAAMLGKMRGMDAALQARAESERSAHQAQALWAACQALWATVRQGEPGSHWREQLRPLKNEIRAVHKVSEGDELVNVVLNNLPKEAEDRGVYPEDALRERFFNVERLARKLALVPDGGASIPIYILSILQSMFIMRSYNPLSTDELENKPLDYSKMDTYDILNRARYFVDHGDLLQALKYMNLLEGAPRKIATDWVQEVRLLLETQQAANTLMAHAAASGLLYL